MPLFFKKQLDNHDVEKIVIHFAGNEKFTAGEIGKFANGFQILNPDLVIFNCESNVKLKIELTIDKGRGYVPAEENKTNSGFKIWKPLANFPISAAVNFSLPAK